jgi:hypothetical protein
MICWRFPFLFSFLSQQIAFAFHHGESPLQVDHLPKGIFLMIIARFFSSTWRNPGLLQWLARALLWRSGRYPEVGLALRLRCVYSAFAGALSLRMSIEFFFLH